jgi:hypothetical protein
MQQQFSQLTDVSVMVVQSRYKLLMSFQVAPVAPFQMASEQVQGVGRTLIETPAI